MHDVTYSLLPPWLQRPLLDKAISQPEAVALWDEYLLTPDDGMRLLPEHLHPVAERLNLWAKDIKTRVQ